MENIEEDNYFAYELDNLHDLHDELKKDFRLHGIMNTSRSEIFISILLSNIIFDNTEYQYISDNEYSDNE